MSFENNANTKSASNPAFTFSTPAFIEDLAGAAQTQLNSEWNRHVNAFTEQAITGAPWNTGTVDGAGDFTPSPRQAYSFNAATTDIPGSSASLAVTWDAFPNRLTVYCGTSTPPTNPYRVARSGHLAPFQDFQGLGGVSLGADYAEAGDGRPDRLAHHS